MPRPVCAIIGAGEGLGCSLAAKFAGEGFDIALVSRSEAGSSAAAAAATQVKAAVNFYAADALQPETIEQALHQSMSDMGEIEVLIYNVRDQFLLREPLDMTYAELNEAFHIEVVGAFAAAKAVLPAMRQRQRGSVFFSSATAAFRGSKRGALYAIGKFGLRALSQSLAKAYAKDGVHVVHVRLDCDLDMPMIRESHGDQFDPDYAANTDDVAQTYWWAHQQPKSAWSNEIELRPYTETWTI